VHQLIHQVAGEYRFKAPRIGFIPDRNPTAFTYGLLRSNARIVVTQGIFEFLTEAEPRAVVGHELGHIVNRDFILMTMAGMLVQILYQIYAVLARSSQGSSDKKGKGAIVGIAALIAYYVGIYLLLYLSRTREYLADAFSASRVEPKALASALVKIAYGIVAIEDTEATQSLLRSTRHLGVIDVKNARYTGLMAQSAEQSPGSAAEAMLFDCYNPWAALVQLNSTHPLTGRRIAHLGEIAQAKGQSFGSYDVEAAAARVQLSRGKLRGQFLAELLLLIAPIVLGLIVGIAGAWQLVPAAIALGVLMTLFLRYPLGAPQGTTVMALMSDPAASPVRGRSVRLEGKAIGPRRRGLRRRRGCRLPGQDGPDGGRLPLDAGRDRRPLRRLETRAAASRQAGQRHRLVQALDGRLPRLGRAQDDGRRSPRAAPVLAGVSLSGRDPREYLLSRGDVRFGGQCVMSEHQPCLRP
jgi:Zn-dependent protease with chaperone function